MKAPPARACVRAMRAASGVRNDLIYLAPEIVKINFHDRTTARMSDGEPGKMSDNVRVSRQDIPSHDGSHRTT
jgi:hypothetical protein